MSSYTREPKSSQCITFPHHQNKILSQKKKNSKIYLNCVKLTEEGANELKVFKVFLYHKKQGVGGQDLMEQFILTYYKMVRKPKH